MNRRQLVFTGLAVAVVLVLAFVAVSCGGGTTTTSAPATTTSTAPVTTSGPPTTAGAVDAAALYAANCAGCHQQVPSANATAAKTAIESGTKSMPSFQGTLSAAQIDALAAYVAAGGK